MIAAGLEGNGSLLFDHLPFKKMEDAPYSRFPEDMRERDRIMSRESGPLTTEGLSRWPTCGTGGNTLKHGERFLFNSDHSSKPWENDIQRQVVLPNIDNRSTPHGRPDLDPFLTQDWTSKSRHSRMEANESPSEIEVLRDAKASGTETLTHSQADCQPCSKGKLLNISHLVCKEDEHFH